MARVAVDATARTRFGASYEGARLYVYLRGTTTQVTGYTTEAGGSTVTYPLLADIEGRYPNAWYPSGSYDLYSPDDSLNSTVPWEAAPGDIDARYRVFHQISLRAQSTSVSSAATFAFRPDVAQPQSATGVMLAYYLNPTAGETLGVVGKTTKLRLVVAAGVNDTAAGCDLTFGLYPIPNISGAINTSNPNFGTVVTGSTVAFLTASLTANSESASVSSGDFTCPVAGWYGIGLVSSAAMTANSQVLFPFRVEYRFV